MARAMAESERQAAYNRQAEEARKIALANLARQNAEDTVTLKATLEPLLGKWVPYTRIEPRRTGEPESEFRALKIDRIADGRGVLTLLLGSGGRGPTRQVPFIVENGSLTFKDEGCAVSFRPARDTDGSTCCSAIATVPR